MQKTIDLLNLELPKLRSLVPDMAEDPVVLGVTNLTNGSIDMRVTCKTLNEKHYGVERELRKRIKELLDENNIKIALPQVVINQAKN